MSYREAQIFPQHLNVLGIGNRLHLSRLLSLCTLGIIWDKGNLSDLWWQIDDENEMAELRPVAQAYQVNMDLLKRPCLLQNHALLTCCARE
jgi:hypothetical protein